MSTNPADDSSVNGLWKQAAEVNRRIDEAVETFERQIRDGGPRTHPLSTRHIAPESLLEPISARPRPPAASPGFSLGALGTSLKTLPPRPTTVADVSAPPTRVDLHAVDVQLAGELGALQAKRAERAKPEALAFSVPWSGTPRPLFVATPNTELIPNPVSDDEIRDVVQPHWRTVHEQAKVAGDALLLARETFERAGLFRRFSGARKALAAAQIAWDEASLSKEALDLLWQGEAMRRQFGHFRTAADNAFGEAMTTANRHDALDAQIAEVERQRSMVAALRNSGVTALQPTPGHTRAQALEVALARLAPPIRLAEETPDHTTTNESQTELASARENGGEEVAKVYTDVAKTPEPIAG